MSRVIVQIGFVKNRKMTQSIKAYLNDEELSWNDGPSAGTYLSSLKDKHYRGMSWFMYELNAQKEDVIRLAVKTYLSGIGLDEENTFESLYYVDEDAPVREFEVPKVGMRGYPLIKGRFLEIDSISEDEKRKADIEEFMNEGF